MGAPVGALFPRAAENDCLLMLFWGTGGFWEAALGFKDSTLSSFLHLLRRERRRSAVPIQTL